MVTLKRVNGAYILTIEGNEVKYKRLSDALGLAWIYHKYNI